MEAKEFAAQLRKPIGEGGIAIGNMMNQGNAVINDLTFNQAAKIKPESLLEIGFGNGKLIPLVIKTTGIKFYKGIDYSTDMVKEAEVFNIDLIENKIVELSEGNFEKINYPDNSFDAVISVNTIYFIPNLTEAFKEAYRVLKPGGMISLGIRPKTKIQKLNLPFTQFEFTFYDAEEVKELLQTTGFEDIEWEEKSEPPVRFGEKEITMPGMCVNAMKPA